MDGTTKKEPEITVKIKTEPIFDISEFVNSDNELVRVKVQLEETTKDNENELNLCENADMVQVKIEEINEGEIDIYSNDDELNAAEESNNSFTHNYKCETCFRIFKTASALNKHGCNICELCNKSFTSSNHLKIHHLSHTGEKPHKCGECGKGFSQKSNLREHAKIHGREKEHKCEVCGKEFKQYQSLARHLKSHADGQDCVCQVCGKRFLFRKDLELHFGIHCDGENPFQCKLCGKNFNQQSTLKTHTLRMHIEEEGMKTILKCDTCNKVFRTETRLNQHDCCICELCGKTFPDRNKMKIHIRTHSGEKPFECNECGKRYSQEGHLKIHGLSHSGERPYKCRQCSKTYAHLWNLKTHLRTAHNTEN